jgi:uncharacterized protein (TIGR02270 family)
MLTRRSRSISWDIYEEHLDEAAFLWGQWEDALVAANYTLDDVAVGPEARLLAHLDGLVLGGRQVAEELLLPALLLDDAQRCAAAAWALVQAEHGGDHQDSVLDVMANGAPPVRAATARALSSAPRADLDRAAQLWPTAPTAVRAVLFGLIGPRQADWAHPRIEPSLRSGDPSLATAALQSLRRMPHPAFTDHIEDALHADAPEVRAEAIAAGVALRSQAAWEACRNAATEPGDGRRLPLGLLATSEHPQDRATVRACASDAEAKRHAIWALGFTGDIEAADVLVEATEDEAVAKIAGESLSAITGLVLGRALVKPGQTVGPDVQEVGDDDPPPIVRTEDHLALPNATALKMWWQRERPRFHPGVDHIQGRPRTPETVHSALATATMWRREVLWLDLARTNGAPPQVDLKAWTADQRRQWSAAAPAPARGR